MTTNAADWSTVKHEILDTLRATEWPHGTVCTHPEVVIERYPTTRRPAGRGAEVVDIITTALAARGYAVSKSHGTRADGCRFVRLRAH